eukprot:scaffold115886_cov63-Cyclotella_meneghiniana.AAC.1
MYGIEIEHEELNQPRRNCLIDEETIGMRFEEPNEDLSWIRSIVKSKQEAKDQRCQARTTNKVELRVRTIKHAFDLGTKGNAQGSEKELMTQCQNEMQNHTENHSLPRVRMLSEGAEAKYDQKQMLMDQKNQEILQEKVRHVTSAIKNGRETYITSTYDQTTDALLLLDKSNQNINEYRRKARMDNTAKHAALQGCA